jgi:hypothetical protein
VAGQEAENQELRTALTEALTAWKANRESWISDNETSATLRARAFDEDVDPEFKRIADLRAKHLEHKT